MFHPRCRGARLVAGASSDADETAVQGRAAGPRPPGWKGAVGAWIAVLVLAASSLASAKRRVVVMPVAGPGTGPIRGRGWPGC